MTPFLIFIVAVLAPATAGAVVLALASLRGAALCGLLGRLRAALILSAGVALAGCDDSAVASLLGSYAPTVLGLAATALLGLLGRGLLDHVWLRGMLERLVVEAKAVVLETEQTYVDAIKEARADGVLTPDEAKAARGLALNALRSNLGRKGLERLSRILGLDVIGLDGLLGTHVEAAVAQLTLAQRAAETGTPPTPAVTLSSPPLSGGK